MAKNHSPKFKYIDALKVSHDIINSLEISGKGPTRCNNQMIEYYSDMVEPNKHINNVENDPGYRNLQNIYKTSTRSLE